MVQTACNLVVHGTAPRAICALCAHYRPRSDRGPAKSLRVGSSTVSGESYRPRCLAKLEASSTIVSIMSAADLSVEAALAEEAMCADRTASARFEHALLLHHPPYHIDYSLRKRSQVMWTSRWAAQAHILQGVCGALRAQGADRLCCACFRLLLLVSSCSLMGSGPLGLVQWVRGSRVADWWIGRSCSTVASLCGMAH